ncbi:hypothetical protein ACKWTF_012592 [Chironomus riparius]
MENLGKFLVLGLIIQTMEGHSYKTTASSLFLYNETQKLLIKNQKTSNYEFPFNSSSENFDQNLLIKEVSTLKSSGVSEYQNNNLLSRVVRSTLGKETYYSCVSKIHSGNIESAVSCFHELNNDNLLPDIIEKSYDYQDEYSSNLYMYEQPFDYVKLQSLANDDHFIRLKMDENFYNIVEFIRKLSNLEQAAVAYSKLYECMKSNGNSNSLKLLILAKMVHETINMPNFINISQDNKIRLFNLTNVSNTVITKWAEDIRTKYVEKFYNENDLFAFEHRETFLFHLPDIIKSAYSNDLNIIYKIITFIKSLPTVNDHKIGYTALYENMKINNHLNGVALLMLSYRIERTMDYIDRQHNYLNYGKLEDIKESLPFHVKRFVWSDRYRCTIYNNYYREPLYTASSWHRYSVFTWVPSNVDPDAYWMFEDTELFDYFKITNLDKKRNLVVSKDRFDLKKSAYTQ